MQPADRLSSVQEYYFSKKLREIRQMEGLSVLNLAIGSPDLSPPVEVMDQLKKGVDLPGAHRYQSYQGIPELREAISIFHKHHYDVLLDADSEILPLIGSKEGITHISLAFLNKGDRVLIPELGYPTYSSVTRMMGVDPVYYPLTATGEPEWNFFESTDFGNIKLIWLNYPHMPTGSPGSLELFRRFVDLATKNNVLIVHDNPYSFILNDNPASIFQVDGAREVALELGSLSKTFNMAGWRIGWVAGSSEHVQHVLKIKSNIDSGMFQPIQTAAVTALDQKAEWFAELNRTYADRRESAMALLQDLGCTWQDDQQGMFLWAKVPGTDGTAFVEDLLEKHHIFIAPGHIFGPKGRPYVRVSLCNPVETFREAMGRL